MGFSLPKLHLDVLHGSQDVLSPGVKVKVEAGGKSSWFTHSLVEKSLGTMALTYNFKADSKHKLADRFECFVNIYPMNTQ